MTLAAIPIPAPLKVCPACGIPKPPNGFYRHGAGRQSWCKDCQCGRPRDPSHHARPERPPVLPGTRAGAVRLPPGYAELLTESGRAALARMAARKAGAH